jgi:hypothetical protein
LHSLPRPASRGPPRHHPARSAAINPALSQSASTPGQRRATRWLLSSPGGTKRLAQWSRRKSYEPAKDPNQRGSFGGPSHGEGVSAIHLAAQSGQRQAVLALLDLGADPTITDDLHRGTAMGWTRVGGHDGLVGILARPVPPRNDDGLDVDAAEVLRAVRVHSILPDALTQAADAALQAAGVQHVAHGTADPVSAAAAAADDPWAVALLGPYRSGAVAEAVLASAPAGLALLAPVATWAGVTRDDEPGGDIPAKHRGTVLRLVAREVARRLANHLLATGQRALVIAGAHEYGRQLDGQLRLVGLPRAERVDDADLLVLAGLAGQPEIAAAAETAPLPVIAFDGAQGATLGDRDVRLALPYAPVEGVPTSDLPAGVQQARHAAELVTRALAEGATDRRTTLAAVRRLGGFDTQGDPPEPPVWLWRTDPAWNLQADRPISPAVARSHRGKSAPRPASEIGLSGRWGDPGRLDDLHQAAVHDVEPHVASGGVVKAVGNGPQDLEPERAIEPHGALITLDDCVELDPAEPFRPSPLDHVLCQGTADAPDRPSSCRSRRASHLPRGWRTCSLSPLSLPLL